MDIFDDIINLVAPFIGEIAPEVLTFLGAVGLYKGGKKAKAVRADRKVAKPKRKRKPLPDSIALPFNDLGHRIESVYTEVIAVQESLGEKFEALDNKIATLQPVKSQPLPFDQDAPIDTLHDVWHGQDGGYPINSRMGRLEADRKTRFVVIHDSGNDRLRWDNAAADTFRWQKTQRENVSGGKPRYSGYHALFDTTDYYPAMDPKRIRAYHAGEANDGIGIMIGPGRSWDEVSMEDLEAMFRDVKEFLGPYNIMGRRALTLYDARVNGGFIGHQDINLDKNDPGDDFPWDIFMRMMRA